MKTPEHDDDLELVAHRFEWARIRLNLNVEDVVREAGYEDIDKGCRRLRNLEDGKPQPESIYARFGQVLDIDLEQLAEDLEQQRRHRYEKDRQQMPPRELGALLESARDREDLTVEQAASRTDEIVSVRRLRRLEGGRDRFPSDAEIEALAQALSVSVEAIRNVCERERRIYDRRGDEPLLIMRAVPGFYTTTPLPQPSSTLQKLQYAQQFAKEKNVSVCLVFPDRRSVYIDPDGNRCESHRPPSMSVG